MMNTMLSAVFSTLFVVGPTPPASQEERAVESRDCVDDASRENSSRGDDPEPNVFLDLYPRETHVSIRLDEKRRDVVAFVSESGQRYLAPNSYVLEAGRTIGRERRWRRALYVEDGQRVHLEVRTSRRIPLSVAALTTLAGGIAMIVTGGGRAVRRGSASAPDWDTTSGVLVGVGAGVFLLGTAGFSWSLFPRIRACRKGPGGAGAFDLCEAS